MNVRNCFFTVLSTLFIAVSFAYSTEPITGYEYLSNWNSLPTLRNNSTGMASSYYRDDSDAEHYNDDYNNYLWPEGTCSTNTAAIIGAIEGPGMITRIFMPHAASNTAFPITITINGTISYDAQGQPSVTGGTVINTDSDALLGGSYGYISSPLVNTAIGGQVSYEPITFSQSCFIETANRSGGLWIESHNYYQYNYVSFAPGTQVQSYTGTLTTEQSTQRQQAINILSNIGSNPAGAQSSTSYQTSTTSILSGQSLSLANIQGSGTIGAIKINCSDALKLSDAQLDGLKLRISYDGSTNHAVDISVAEFFRAGHGRIEYQSLPMGTQGDDGYYCYLPMPYREGVKVELYNESGETIDINGATIESVAGAVDSNAAYFYAVSNSQITESGQHFFEILDINGTGHLVGLAMNGYSTVSKAPFFEGDTIISADGEVLHGTGFEDDYNGGYYFNYTFTQTDDGDTASLTPTAEALYGALALQRASGEPTRADLFRWMISDAVTFDETLNINFDNMGWQANTQYGSVAYFYMIPEPLSVITLIAAGTLFIRQRKRN